MKLNGILEEAVINEQQDPRIIQRAFDNYERMETILEALHYLKSVDASKLKERELKHFTMQVEAIEAELGGLFEAVGNQVGVLSEAVDRQFRRYGDKFLRQYRCTTGQKAGRMVSSPEKCGIRKDPRRVRIGKKSARVKKGQRIRKTKFTKRKTQSKRLSRMNNTLRGDS